MRRLVAVLALVLGGLSLSGCVNMCWSDPLHPCTTNSPLCYAR